MNKLIKYKKIIVIFGVIISVLFGIFIFYKISNNSMNYLLSNSNNLNYINYKVIIFHILLFAFALVTSFLGIGIITLFIYLIFESIIIGFMSSYFISLYGINGIMYSVIYTLIYKALLIFLTIILIFKFIKLLKFFIKYLTKEKIDITKTIANSIIIYILIILNDIFLLLFGKYIINIFSFMIK